MKDYNIEFQPVGQQGQCQEEDSLLDCARRLNIGISSVCSGQGTCNTCRIKLVSGVLSDPTPGGQEALPPQELADGWRLACQATPTSDCQIMVSLESMSALQRVCVEGWDLVVTPAPPVKAYRVQLASPSLSEQQADADRLIAALNEQHQLCCPKIDVDVLRAISPQIRGWDWQCQVSVRDDEVVALNPWSSQQLGLAVDLGTTTIAGYLLDLNTGQTLASKGILNPQTGYGEDIISRINHVIKSPQDGSQLQGLVVQKVNELATTLCSEVGLETAAIVEVVIVGNTAMDNLSLGLPVRQLALTPFTAATSLALDIKACRWGMNIAPGAYIHFPLVIASSIGSDHLAMLLATALHQIDGPVIVLDIGTNTEISLINGEEITTASCASGPALEGGHIQHGMRAARGAIERVRITGDAIDYQTIDGAPPVGICGSGVLDAIAQLYLAGIIGDNGRLTENHPRVHFSNGQMAFYLTDGEEQDGKPVIVITQQDIREIQLAKAAIRSGIQLLLEMNGFNEEQVGQVIAAGAFGSYIDLSSAVTIGLLPPLPLDCFQQVGNAAGMGAKMVLVSLTERKKSEEIASRIRYIELATNPGFRKTFIETNHIGRYWVHRGQREVLGYGSYG